MRYSDVLQLNRGDVVSIVGSGGKTSLLWRLARENRARGVLVSTTTRMRWSEVAAFDWDINCRGAHCAPAMHENAKGRGRTMCAPTGVSVFHGGMVDGKIIAPTMERLAVVCAGASLTLLECDGSKGLPIKGWAAHEPVVPTFATVTIGVLPLWAIGMPVSKETVHRVERFCAITGAVLGDVVRVEHLASVVNHPDGLFAKTRGRRVLFLNDRGGMVHHVGANCVRPLIPADVLVVCGDIHRGTIEVIQ